MVTVEIQYLTCPACGKKICNGVPRFGPGKVKCGHCNAYIDSRLDEWAGLFPGEKFEFGIKEILSPSFFNFYWVLFVCFTLPLYPLYLLLFLGRLLYMIHESNRFTSTRVSPVWKA